MLPAEKAHDISILFLKTLAKTQRPDFAEKILVNHLFGLYFTNPVGLAAGYDKNAEVFSKLYNYNFGFVECGTVTPKAQSGNDKPRLFRLTEDRAVINRFGFNNVGMEQFTKNLENGKSSLPSGYPIGVNIGKNKLQEDFLADYLTLLEQFYNKAHYLTINISSPNTPNLRDIQSSHNLENLISNINNLALELEKKHDTRTPILYKIAPDQTEESLQDICDISLKHNIDGLIISNTTITRPDSLISKHKHETGGLSGAPLKTLANKILADVYKATNGKIKIIGVGGIESADDAYYRILNGASLIQIYSSLVYQGFGLAQKINIDLAEKLKMNGFKNISEAIGAGINS
jgi:dihydroorotate dehydrogenase